MKKGILIAVALILVGAVICFSTAARFDLEKLGNGEYVTNTYPVSKPFENISVTASTEKVFLQPSEDGKCTVICVEEEDHPHEVSVNNGTLTIRKPAEDQKFSLHFGLSVQSQEITVCLPESVYSDLLIQTDTGDVDIPADFGFDSITVNGDTADVTCLASAENGLAIAVTTGDLSVSPAAAGSMDLKTTTGTIHAESVKCAGDVTVKVDTGKVKLEDVTCRNLTSEGTTGDLTLDHVVAADTLSVTRSTGDVELIESDAESIFIETDTGNVKGSLLTDKVFLTETDTGKIDVPKSTSGGRCEISTDTGDIRIEVR